MFNKLILLTALVLLVIPFYAVTTDKFDYKKAWTEADKCLNDRLPISMLEKVDKIYQAAVKENNSNQQIKALVYQLIALQSIEEFSQQKAINQVNERLVKAEFPVSAILHCMQAQLYLGYYQNNRWKYGQRNETINFDKDDIATWDLKTIFKAAMSEYDQALVNSTELKKIRVEQYPDVISGGDKYTRTLRPTLYDFLANQALGFYANDESGLTMPFEEFTMTDTKYFQPAGSFALMQISSADTLSLKYKALQLFQELIRFHLNDRDPAALVDVDLTRLAFIYNDCAITNPETYYETALRQLMSKYQGDAVFSEVSYDLAKLIQALGSRYNPEKSEQYRWNYRDATDICQAAIKAYPKSFGAQCCEALKKNIEEPQISVNIENIVLPDTPIKTLIGVTNLSKIYLNVYRIPHPDYKSDEYDYDQDYKWGNKDTTAHLLKGKPVLSKTISMENEGDFRSHAYEALLGNLPKGKYVLLASDDVNMSVNSRIIGYSVFTCSRISYALPSHKGKCLMVADRQTGKPIENATVMCFRGEYNNKKSRYVNTFDWSLQSDKDGFIYSKKTNDTWNTRYYIIKGTDTLSIDNLYLGGSSAKSSITKSTILFTDRSIYRPGQTIYFKGIVFESDHEKYHKILSQTRVSVTLYDVNYQKVSSLELTTNDFGTFNGSFTAPKGVLTGQMHIQTNYNGNVYFSVEEYKRPKFEVTIDKPKETYKLGQYVNVTGKALSYAGFPIDNAVVDYRIVRQPKYPYWFWWWGTMPSTPQKEIIHGSVVTNEQGEFNLSFMAQGDDSISDFGNPYFGFTVNADVTDISGETRTGSLTLYIGKKELVLDVTMPEKVDNTTKSLVIPVSAKNLSGEKIAANGSITISRLQIPDHIMRNRLWNAPDRNYMTREEFLKLFPNDPYGKEDNILKWKVLDEVFTGKFNTPDVDSVLINKLGNWATGVYVLEATSIYQQEEVKTTRYFTVYNSAAKQLPYPMADWFVPVKTTCEPGENAQVLIGSSYANVSVIYLLEKDHKVVDSLRFELNKEQRLFTLPVRESDRGGFTVHFMFIREGRVYTHDQQITVPWTNKKIDFEYSTFRNKLLPGQDEEWSLKLKDYTGGAVTAEVLASMYDASLDAFSVSKWNAGIYGQIYSSIRWNANNFVSNAYLTFLNNYSGCGEPTREYDMLQWYGYYSGWYPTQRYNRYNNARSLDLSIGDELSGSGRKGMMAMQAGAGSMEMASPKMMKMSDVNDSAVNDTEGIVALAKEQTAADYAGGEDKAMDLGGVQARTNFAETAFFLPQLRTDEEGNVSVSFTVPEALTRWKFRALAITQDLKIGTTENTTVTQKPLMVIPNAPRFFREGDKITFAAKITCLDESDQSGACQLMLFDAITMEPVDKSFGLTKAQKPFSVKKGESTVLNWDLTIPFGISAVTYRVVAKSGDFSDGEENTLPILTNRMLVTESLPLPVRGYKTKAFTFEKLKNFRNSSTLKNHKLTLEYTSNPAWYAVQALPYMMEYPYECNEQIFTRFYANSLASHIANSNPRIKKVFESWKNTPNSTALLSNLEKNEELKSVILQETPWVLDAKNESQSKQRIALLFELNNLADQFERSLTKLSKNQNPSGAWPWFSGMQDSWWVTQYIVEGLGHLDHLKITSIRTDYRTWNMIQKAIQYLDRMILQDYENIKKYSNLKDDHLGYMEMHYLYTRSFFKDIKIPAATQVAVDYFKDQSLKYWNNKDIYGQGLLALGMYRYGNEVLPEKIIASLKERALHSDELGMWWKSNTWGWYWYQAPIETQSLLIEAFTDITKDEDSIDEMRTWLLKNKQTTNWKTTKATAEAVYALLLSGTEWLNTDKLAEITIGGNKIDPNALEGVKVEAGTGYFKTSWSGNEITPQMAEVTVSNPNDVPAWGSLYWQYFENLDKITPAETPLKLNKKLFLEKVTDTGVVLDPISDKNVLSIGDKVIVRIELRSDRDMEYVHMKDMRSSGFEPINVISRYKWQDGLGYYEATGDAATNFFIEYLSKGTYVFEYPLRVTNKGDFSNGITTIQCMYAPEFTSHSEGIRVEVK